MADEPKRSKVEVRVVDPKQAPWGNIRTQAGADKFHAYLAEMSAALGRSVYLPGFTRDWVFGDNVIVLSIHVDNKEVGFVIVQMFQDYTRPVKTARITGKVLRAPHNTEDMWKFVLDAVGSAAFKRGATHFDAVEEGVLLNKGSEQAA